MRILLSALLISMATAYPSTCEEMRDVSANYCPEKFSKLMKAYGYQCGWADKTCLQNSKFNPKALNIAILNYAPDPDVNYAQTVFVIDDWNGNILDEYAESLFYYDDTYTYIGIDCSSEEARNFCDILPLYACQGHQDNRILAIDQYFHVDGDYVNPHESVISIIRGIHDELKLPMFPIVLNDNDWNTINDACTCDACWHDFYSYECQECTNQGIFGTNGEFNSQCFFDNLDPESVSDRWVGWESIELHSKHRKKLSSTTISDEAKKKILEITGQTARKIVKKLSKKV